MVMMMQFKDKEYWGKQELGKENDDDKRNMLAFLNSLCHW
jgi:hypothetical protein